MNYARMEDVWRSYGPLEAIGPEENGRRARRRTVAIAAGVLAVCALGAGAGLYLQPDLDDPGDVAVAARELDRRPQARAQGAAPSAGSAALGEAEALEAQLQLAVADSAAPLPTSLPPSGPRAQFPPFQSSTPQLQLPRREPPASRPGLVQPAPGHRPPFVVRTEPGAPRPAPSPAGAPSPVRSAVTPGPPLVVASVPPPMRSYPREAPVIRPAPRLPTPTVSPPPPPAVAAGPDCARAGNAADRMVCESPDLAALDRRMESELAAAVAAGHSRNLLLRDQNDWRARRDAAAPDPRAVADAYRRRIGQLRSMQ